MKEKIENFMNELKAKHPNQPEFHQAVEEVMNTVMPVYEANPRYKKYNILERIVEPERVIIFRVEWVDDNGNVRVNRGYRVQMNSAIGPYKGGLRFHPTVNLGILKFLAFEQIFKNALTTLPMGGGKGGSDFDPKGKSEYEMMRFCQAFMTELYRHIGPNTDVPAGDIGVGAREIGYMFGKYKKITNEFTGVLTGKGIKWGGSLIRPEATGYGLIYFVEELLKTKNDTLKNKIVTMSGSGNVAQFSVEKCIELGAKVVTLSDSTGMIYDEKGIDKEKLNWIKELKNIKRGRIKDYAEEFDCEYYEDRKPWTIKCDIALPNATENELNGEDAKQLLSNGCFCVAEGANMPCTPEAQKYFIENKILYAPGKATNAGGVATSGLEMSQNSLHLNWQREEVNNRLKQIMQSIHKQCVIYGKKGDFVNYIKGANIAGFVKVADAMCDQGIV